MSRPAVYPWEDWFSRRRKLVLRQGRDFSCQMHGMANQLRNAASRLGYRVSIIVDGDTLVVETRKR